MNNIDNFLTNLVNTCKKDSVILEDGTSRSIFGRIRDFFNRKKASDYFAVVCTKLTEAVKNKAISQLSNHDQIEILTRIKQVSKKLGTEQEEIEKLAEEVFKNSQGVKEVALNIFKNLNKNSKRYFLRTKETDKDLQKIEVILDYHKDNSSFTNYLFENWEPYRVIEEKYAKHRGNSKFIRKTHLACLKLFMKVQEKQAKKAQEIQALESDSRRVKYKYARTFFMYLEQLKQRKDSTILQEMESQIQNLLRVIIVQKDNAKFINKVLENMDLFLERNVFVKSLFLNARYCHAYEIYSGLFEVCNKYLHHADPKIQTNLKVKFANLPFTKNRDSYKKLFLTRKNQVEIILNRLNLYEGRLFDYILRLKTLRFSLEELHLFAKLAHSKSVLSSDNREKLRSVVVKILEEDPRDWNDFVALKKKLQNFAVLDKKNCQVYFSLKKHVSVKKFFQSQTHLDEDLIQIPRWYHATKKQHLEKIISSKKIKVMHRTALPGAWVSSAIQYEFGNYILVLNDRIQEIKTTLIGVPKRNRHWRGLLNPIPLKSDTTQSLAYVGVRLNRNRTLQDKDDRKKEKIRLVQILRKHGFHNTVVLSHDKLEMIRKYVEKVVGFPNLPPLWWGSPSQCIVKRKGDQPVLAENKE